MRKEGKIKIVHIHTDPKFVGAHSLYKDHHHESLTVYIDTKWSLSPVFRSEWDVIVYNDSSESLNKLNALIKDCDVMIIHDLDSLKVKIVLSAPPHVKILLRLFGYELYDQKKDIYLSKVSRKYLDKDSFFESLKKKIRHLITQEERLFESALKRINRIMLHSQEEYDDLSQYFKLPPLILMPFYSHVDRGNIQYPKEATVVIGNSRSIYNNHLEIIDVLKKCAFSGNINFIFFLSYGSQGDYYNKVIEELKGLKSTHIYTDFMPREDFMKIYENTAALVVNSYRQMALGNIFAALRNGTKVYLNVRNPVYNWLKNNAFLVFLIEDFEKDVVEGNLYLSMEDIEHNILMLERLGLYQGQEKLFMEIDRVLVE